MTFLRAGENDLYSSGKARAEKRRDATRRRGKKQDKLFPTRKENAFPALRFNRFSSVFFEGLLEREKLSNVFLRALGRVNFNLRLEKKIFSAWKSRFLWRRILSLLSTSVTKLLFLLVGKFLAWLRATSALREKCQGLLLWNWRKFTIFIFNSYVFNELWHSLLREVKNMNMWLLSICQIGNLL